MAEAEEATITNGSIKAGEGTRGMGSGRSVDMGRRVGCVGVDRGGWTRREGSGRVRV